MCASTALTWGSPWCGCWPPWPPGRPERWAGSCWLLAPRTPSASGPGPCPRPQRCPKYCQSIFQPGQYGTNQSFNQTTSLPIEKNLFFWIDALKKSCVFSVFRRKNFPRNYSTSHTLVRHGLIFVRSNHHLKKHYLPKIVWDLAHAHRGFLAAATFAAAGAGHRSRLLGRDDEAAIEKPQLHLQQGLAVIRNLEPKTKKLYRYRI